jgi:hypothetical protein
MGRFPLAARLTIRQRHQADDIASDLRMGGTQKNPSQLLLRSRVDMTMASEFEGFNYVKAKLPLL